MGLRWLLIKYFDKGTEQAADEKLTEGKKKGSDGSLWSICKPNSA